MSAALELRGLTADYGGVRVLHGIDLDLGRQETVALLGANGAGKTTLLRAVSRMVHTTGTVRVLGQDVSGRGTAAVARLGLGHVPEGRGTFADLSVAENLRLGALARGRRDRREVRADTERVLALFPVLEQMTHRQAGALSGGQQQMLAVARALLGRPRVLLVDEPSLGLAPLVTRDLFRLLATLAREWDLALLLAEQNARLSLQIADRAVVLASGRVAAEGPAAELARDERLRAAYLGLPAPAPDDGHAQAGPDGNPDGSTGDSPDDSTDEKQEVTA